MKRKNPLEKAIQSVIDDCIENDILKEFFEKNRPEVIDMMKEEFYRDIALKAASENGIRYVEGMEKGIEKGLNYVFKLMEQGLSFEEIEKEIEKKPKKKHR